MIAATHSPRTCFLLVPSACLGLRGCSRRLTLLYRSGGRALDILIALAERAGEVITHKELISVVWPDVTVEEANLRFQMAALRKALGDGRDGARYISNIAGRGYCFVAPVTSRAPSNRLRSLRSA